MNWDTIEGKWTELKGDIKGRWAKLTDDDLAHLGAKREMLIGKIQQRYGVMKDDAERQVDEWLAKLDHELKSHNKPH
jgi:uncharacterized protein YjbJ (UPF0337 family)